MKERGKNEGTKKQYSRAGGKFFLNGGPWSIKKRKVAQVAPCYLLGSQGRECIMTTMATTRLQSVAQTLPPFPLVSVSPPLSSLPFCALALASTAVVVVASILCGSADASFSSACHLRMKASAPSSTRRNHLPIWLH